MFSRIIALSVLLVPLALVAAAPAAGAAVGSLSAPPDVTARTAAATVSAAQPTLRLGSRGSAVVALQHRLIALHYFDVSAADGVFGQNTYHAVIAFQKVQGLLPGRRRRPGYLGQAGQAVCPGAALPAGDRVAGGDPVPAGHLLRP